MNDLLNVRAVIEKFFLPRVADNASDVVHVELLSYEPNDVRWAINGKRGRLTYSLPRKDLEAVSDHVNAIVAVIDKAAHNSAMEYLEHPIKMEASK